MIVRYDLCDHGSWLMLTYRRPWRWLWRRMFVIRCMLCDAAVEDPFLPGR